MKRAALLILFAAVSCFGQGITKQTPLYSLSANFVQLGDSWAVAINLNPNIYTDYQTNAFYVGGRVLLADGSYYAIHSALVERHTDGTPCLLIFQIGTVAPVGFQHLYVLRLASSEDRLIDP